MVITDVDKCTILDIYEYEGKDNILIEAPEGNYYINEDGYYKITALIDTELPAMGYKVFSIENGKCERLESSKKLEIKNSSYRLFIENEKLCVQMNDEKIIEDFITFEDCGNDGDTYDFSPLRGDSLIYFRIINGISMNSQGFSTLNLEGTIKLPKDLNSRLNHENLEEVKVNLKLALDESEDIIKCKVVIDNNIKSHRLRVIVKSEIFTDESIASIPFGYIKRPILNGNIGKWDTSYLENPIDIEVFDGTVSITDNKNTMSIYSKGIKEYQVIEDKIYLTLLSTTSQLGKPNLLYRPGRASGDTTKQGHVMIETPNAELLGIREFEFAISMKNKLFDETLVEKTYEKYTTEDVYYQLQMLNKFINRIDNKIQNINSKVKFERNYSLLEVDKDICFSSISPSLKDDSILLRLKNPSNNEVKVDNFKFEKFKSLKIVNTIEEELEQDIIIIDPYSFITIKLK